jgi:4-hydroxybenzoate polyprenyltransferase
MTMTSLTTHHYPSRMRIYLAETFPVPERMALAAAWYLGIAGFTAATLGAENAFLSLHTAVGVFSMFALLLILRLMDELKDLDIDQRLFADRAVPSGRVRVSDIRLSLVVISVLFMAANAMCGAAVISAAIVLGYATLMYRFFFMPKLMRRHLPLALISHNPIVPMIAAHGFVDAVEGLGADPLALNQSGVWAYLAMVWAMFFSWEIARKIRSQEEENEYVTYSQLLGRGRAVGVAWVSQLLCVALGGYVQGLIGWSPAALTAMGCALVVTSFGYLRFIRRPSPATSKLRLFTEVFIALMFIAQVIAFAYPV